MAFYKVDLNFSHWANENRFIVILLGVSFVYFNWIGNKISKI